jgi:hypothetical protein
MALRPLIKRAQAVFRRTSADREEAAASSVDTGADVDRTTVHNSKTDGERISHPEDALPNNGAELPGVPYEELQRGVQEAEAVAQTWSKASLIFVFIKYVKVVSRCDILLTLILQ